MANYPQYPFAYPHNAYVPTIPPPAPYLAPPEVGRGRRNSWHARVPPRSPGYAPPTPQATTPQPYPPYPHFNTRPVYPDGRRPSFDHAFVRPLVDPVWGPGYPRDANPHHSPYGGWMFGGPPELPPPQIHPLLNGDTLPQYLILDLASHIPSVQRRVNPSQSVPLTAHELEQAVTSPETLRLRIVSDAFPQWPLDLSITGSSLNPPLRGRPALPYITVGDVIFSLHAHLHTPITHEEWGRLNATQETDVAKAYTKRTKAHPASEREQRREGVKRVDYLLRKHAFNGFTWTTPENGVERLKLLVGMS